MTKKYFIALSREAGLSAGMLASGTDLLLKANSWEDRYYSQAFFDISIGIERLLKIIFIINFYNKNNKTFPKNDALIKYGHKIVILFEEIEKIALDYQKKIEMSEIQKDILVFLGRFAKKTRYYNLDYISEQADGKDPILDWAEVILKIPIPKKIKNKSIADSQFLHDMFDECASVMGTTEAHKPITNIKEASENVILMEYYNKEGRILILQFIRSLVGILTEITYEIQKKADKSIMPVIPDLHDFFLIFSNDDQYLRKRRCLHKNLR